MVPPREIGLLLQEHLSGKCVILELIDLDASLNQGSLVTKILETHSMHLANISHVIDRKASLELVRKLGHLLPVAQRENHMSDLVILARCKFFSDASNRYDFS